VLNIGVKNFGKFEMGGVWETYVYYFSNQIIHWIYKPILYFFLFYYTILLKRI